MTFYEFTRLPATPEREMLLQSIAILSTQPRFEKMSPDEVFAFVETQAATIKAAA